MRCGENEPLRNVERMSRSEMWKNEPLRNVEKWDAQKCGKIKTMDIRISKNVEKRCLWIYVDYFLPHFWYAWFFLNFLFPSVDWSIVYRLVNKIIIFNKTPERKSEIGNPFFKKLFIFPSTFLSTISVDEYTGKSKKKGFPDSNFPLKPPLSPRQIHVAAPYWSTQIPQKSPVMSTEMFHRDVSQIFISSHVLFFLHLLFFLFFSICWLEYCLQVR